MATARYQHKKELEANTTENRTTQLLKYTTYMPDDGQFGRNM
jgi:hypothetical protein